MNEEYALLCRRYATAFLNVNGKQISLNDCEEFKNAAQLVRVHRSWLVFFDLPDLSDEKREQMITILIEKLHLPSIVQSLLVLLDHHRRIGLLPEVLDSLVKLFFERHDLIYFTIRSYPTLSAEQLNIIKNFLMAQTGKNILYVSQECPALIAGVRALSGTLLWEYSIEKKLREAQQVMDEQG